MPAKKATTTKSASKAKVSKSAAAPKTTKTAVRNTAIPKAVTPVKREVTHEMIAARAYEIWKSGQGGSELENWARAERELRGV